MKATAVLTTMALGVLSFAGLGAGEDIQKPKPTQVKVAAVQMLAYDKTDVPRPGFDPSESVVRWVMKRGDDFPVFDLDFGRVGILTCYDGWFPETFRILSLKGAEILVWINGRRCGMAATLTDFGHPDGAKRS